MEDRRCTISRKYMEIKRITGSETKIRSIFMHQNITEKGDFTIIKCPAASHAVCFDYNRI